MRCDLVRNSVFAGKRTHTCLLAVPSHTESKGETGFVNLEKLIKARGTLVKGCIDDITQEVIPLCIIILSDIPLSTSQCEALLDNSRHGGGLLILLNECLDEPVLSSVNFLLESLSISVCPYFLN